MCAVCDGTPVANEYGVKYTLCEKCRERSDMQNQEAARKTRERKLGIST
jgi:hypothetical protein